MTSDKAVLEPYTPYEQSLMWRVHHAYFAQRGAAVWTEREIPSQGTSNSAQARRHVRLFAALVADLEASGALAPNAIAWVLEPGAGSGDFAVNFLEALEDLDPKLLDRTRYIMSDYVARTMHEAAALPRVRTWVATGTLVPALYDLARPEHLADLEGRPIDARLALVVSNYVCCALPMKPLQKVGASWRAPWVETRADLGGQAPAAVAEALCRDATRPQALAELETRWQWRDVALSEVLEPADQAVLEAATAELDEASLFYPALWFGFLRGVAARMLPQAVVITNDYGFVERDRIAGLHERRPERFANCLGQEVQFVLFDAFARATGAGLVRSDDPLDEIHQAVVGPHGIGSRLRSELARRPLWGRPEWAHLLDFQAAAQHFAKHGDGERSLRFWQRCAEIDPQHADFHYCIGELATELGLHALATRHLELGLALDPERFDWEHMLGRAASVAGDYDSARIWYQRSLMREDHPVTCVNLAALALEAGDVGQAYRWLERALGLDPTHALALERMAEVRERVWQAAVDAFRHEHEALDLDDVVVEDGEDGEDGEDDGEVSA